MQNQWAAADARDNGQTGIWDAAQSGVLITGCQIECHIVISSATAWACARCSLGLAARKTYQTSLSTVVVCFVPGCQAGKVNHDGTKTEIPLHSRPRLLSARRTHCSAL